MDITIFSFFSSVFWSSILIVAIYLLRKTRRFKTSFGLAILVILYLFCVVRSVLPLEFPFTMPLGIDSIYPQIYRFLTIEYAINNTLKFSVLAVLIFLWLAGAIILLTGYVVRYHKTMNSVLKYASPCGEHEYLLLEQIVKPKRKMPKITIYRLPSTDVPFGTGVFRKAILLPESPFTDRELQYILLHEYTHFLNKDILVKISISIFCAAFWWNPVVYLLKADLEQTLEMKCDVRIVSRLDEQEKADYLRTLVKVMKQCASTNKTAASASMALFGSDRALDIRERFEVVMRCKGVSDRKIHSLAVLLISLSIFIVSYSIVPQPAFDSPTSIAPNVIDLDSANSYLEVDVNGDYWICVDGKREAIVPDKMAKEMLKTGFSVYKE